MKMTRLFAGALLAVVPLVVAPVAQASAGSDAPVQTAAQGAPATVAQSSAAYSRTILTKVNELRASLGLKPVTRYAQLDSIAQDWSDQMASRNSMSHRPQFASGYPSGWNSASENVAMRGGSALSGDIGAQLFEQWRNSPGHYANMVSPDANALGIGLAYNSSTKSWYATQNFAGYQNPTGPGLVAHSGASPVLLAMVDWFLKG